MQLERSKEALRPSDEMMKRDEVQNDSLLNSGSRIPTLSQVKSALNVTNNYDNKYIGNPVKQETDSFYRRQMENEFLKFKEARNGV